MPPTLRFGTCSTRRPRPPGPLSRSSCSARRTAHHPRQSSLGGADRALVRLRPRPGVSPPRPEDPERATSMAWGAAVPAPFEAMAGSVTAGLEHVDHPLPRGSRQPGRQAWSSADLRFTTPRGLSPPLLGFVRPTNVLPHAPESEGHRLRGELMALRERLHACLGFDSLIGRGAEHRRLLDQVAAASATTVPVLIVGEPGTGKLLVARTIHLRGASSAVADPAVRTASGYRPRSLERQLLQAARTAPVGPGPIQSLPDGATLLIGDVLELPRDLQGSACTSSLDGRIRLIATTIGDPDAAFRSGSDSARISITR